MDPIKFTNLILEIINNYQFYESKLIQQKLFIIF